MRALHDCRYRPGDDRHDARTTQAVAAAVAGAGRLVVVPARGGGGVLWRASVNRLVSILISSSCEPARARPPPTVLRAAYTSNRGSRPQGHGCTTSARRPTSLTPPPPPPVSAGPPLRRRVVDLLASRKQSHTQVLSVVRLVLDLPPVRQPRRHLTPFCFRGEGTRCRHNPGTKGGQARPSHFCDATLHQPLHREPDGARTFPDSSDGGHHLIKRGALSPHPHGTRLVRYSNYSVTRLHGGPSAARPLGLSPRPAPGDDARR
eukprot:scaffold7400_cov100-Isochrysis_galbana.AAC.5